MQKTLQQWVDLFSAVDLPVLGQSLQALAKLETSSGDVSGARIAAVVLPDPMMVLKVMRLANSGRSGRFAQPVTTIEHAVMMLGQSVSFGRMLTCPALEKTLIPAAQVGLLAVVGRAYHAAFHVRDWALLRLDLNVEEMYIATLLQELGEMALWAEAPEEMVALRQLRRKIGREAAEQQLLGFSCDELTLALAKAWNLPPLIAGAFNAAECETHPRPRLVSLAKQLARLAECGWYGNDLQQNLEQIAETLHIGADDAIARVHRVAAEAARNRSFPEVVPAAAWLPMLPGLWPEDEASEPQQAAIAVSPRDPFAQAMDRMAAHLDDTLTLHDLMLLVLQGMRDGIGLKRVVFALMTRDRSKLQATYVVGAQDGEALKGFTFDMQQPHLFSKMLAKQQAIWLNDYTRAQAGALLNAEIRRICAAEHFFAMTVAVRGKVVGLIYADGGAGSHPLDLAGYEKFKTLCTQAALNLGHLAKS